LEEIAERQNLTRERVRQIKEKAIRRLKNQAKCKNLRSYLG
jgi:RNA polymerase primary sigma factor